MFSERRLAPGVTDIPVCLAPFEYLWCSTERSSQSPDRPNLLRQILLPKRSPVSTHLPIPYPPARVTRPRTIPPIIVGAESY